MSRMCACEAHSWSARSPWMACRTVAVGSRSSDWDTNSSRTPPVRVTRPPSGRRRPANVASRVDLPAPFCPTTPTRAPSSRPSVRPRNRGREPTTMSSASAPRRCGMDQLSSTTWAPGTGPCATNADSATVCSQMYSPRERAVSSSGQRTAMVGPEPETIVGRARWERAAS